MGAELTETIGVSIDPIHDYSAKLAPNPENLTGDMRFLLNPCRATYTSYGLAVGGAGLEEVNDRV